MKGSDQRCRCEYIRTRLQEGNPERDLETTVTLKTGESKAFSLNIDLVKINSEPLILTMAVEIKEPNRADPGGA